MNEKHINKSPISCEVESQISHLMREAESKSPLPCGGGLGVGIIPQGYKQTSIGTIPQDWEVVRLGEVGDLFAGGDVPKENFSKTKTAQYQIPIFSNGVGANALYGYTNQAKVDKPCITISARGTIGHCILHIEPFFPIVRLIVVLPSLSIDIAFLKNYIDLVGIESTNAGIPQLTIPMIRNFQIPLPPLKEQEKIVRILGVWDSAIDTLANLIKAKRKYKTALMQRLLTPPKDTKSTHPQTPSAREGEQESSDFAREGLSLDSTHCEVESQVSPLPCGGGLGVGIKTDKSPSHRPLAPYMKEFSRAMRKNPTQAENKLWQELRGKKLGFGFRRQFVIDSKYIADFVCLEKRLIIECDGGEHNQNFNDIQRDFYLESQNFRILRFWNNEILGNLDGVLCVIKEALESNGDFANAKYTCKSTHPLAPSAREGEQENCPRANEGESHQSSLRFAGFSDKWQEFRLGDLLKEKNIRNANNVNLVLSVTNKQGFVAQKDYFEQEVASNDTSNYKVVYRGEFAYNPARINVGSIAMLENFENGILSPMYIVFECLEKISKDFFKYWLESHNFRGILGKYLSGSVRETLSFNDMKTMKIFIPTLAEQKKIAQVLSACDKEIETLNLKFECLKAQKRGLMQQLLSGKVRVKC